MKYILILYMIAGTPEHHTLATAEFDDKPACEAAAQAFHTIYNHNTIAGVCVPKATARKK